MELVNRFNNGVNFDDLFQKDIATQYCVLSALKDAKGHDYRVTRSALVRRVQLIWYWHISKVDKPPGDRKIRETVNKLRKSGALIVSTGGCQGGYWIPESKEENQMFRIKELRSRAFDLLSTDKAMTKAEYRKWGGQMDLWKDELQSKLDNIICAM